MITATLITVATVAWNRRMGMSTLEEQVIQMRTKLAEAVEPVLDWLYEYGDPYTRVEITMAETNVYETFMGLLENEVRD